MKGRKDLDNGSLRWLALIVIGILAICVSMAGADTYTAADSNANGQYQVTLTVNPDGTMVVNAVGVLGGTYSNEGEPASTYSGDVFSQESNPYYNDLEMSGSYGYALLTGQDASGNKAAVETGFTNADNVQVTQEIRLNSPENLEQTSQDSYSLPSYINGIEASQHVRSCDFDSIYASGRSEAIDGSTASVAASATNSDCWSMFRVNQWASINFDPFDTHGDSYGDGGGMFGQGTEAHQDGSILFADTASVSASASSPAGYSSAVSGSITDGSMRFRTWASAVNGSGPILPKYSETSSSTLYQTEANGDIDTKSQQGIMMSTATNPDGNSATVLSQWTWDACWRPGWVYTDLEASTKEKIDRSVIKTETNIYRSYGYTGSVNAQNSVSEPETVRFGYEYLHERHVGGGAGIVADISGSATHDWVYVYPDEV